MSQLNNKNKKPLTISEKLKILRKNAGMTQAEFSEAIWSNPTKVSRAESGEDEYNEEEINAARKHFGIEDMPLTELEREAFKARLDFWRDLIKDHRLEEAKEIEETVSPILMLEDFERDLAIFYRSIEVLSLLTCGALDEAEEKLSYLENVLVGMNTENRYYYHSLMGSLYAMRHKYKDALKFYEKADEISESRFCDISLDEKGRLYVNMAYCHTKLESHLNAIILLNQVQETGIKNRITHYSLSADISLAVNYIKIGEYKKARRILDKCLVQAKGIRDNLYVGIVFLNLGLLHMNISDWDEAIRQLDVALLILKKAHSKSDHYTLSFYYKIRCLIYLKKFREADRELAQITIEDNVDDMRKILYKSLRRILFISKSKTVYNEEAAEYIEHITVPYFIDFGDCYEAVKCLELLSDYYLTTRKSGKSIEMRLAIGEIYKRMLIKQEDGDIL